MEVTYQLVQRDFFDSLVAFRNRSALRKWGLRIIGFSTLGLAAIGLLMLAMYPNAQYLSTYGPILFIAGLWVLMLWGGPWWAARMQFRKQPSVQGPITATLSEKGVSWKWDGGSSEVEWKTFHRWQECKTQFLLFTSPVMFNMIPKRVLSPEQESEVRNLLTEHVGKTAVTLPPR
jgi:hypothetical protein